MPDAEQRAGLTRDCFICHAGEDKDEVARPLAEALQDRGYEVWFDEFEVDVGDSLRQRIDQGLAASRFGVVVLSERFFQKKWPQDELDGLFAKEVVGEDRIILPVWHGVDEEFLAGVSPILAGRVGVTTSEGIPHVVDRIAQAMDRLPNRSASETVQSHASATVTTSPATPEPIEMIEDGTRVRTELDDDDKRVWRDRFGHPAGGPGWLSVVVGPSALKDDLINPAMVGTLELRNLNIEGAWDTAGAPLSEYNLRVGIDGFMGRIPDSADDPRGFEVVIHQDGLLEMGKALVRIDDTDGRRFLPVSSIAVFIHDATLNLLEVLRHVGYKGEVASMVAFRNVLGYEVATEAGRDFWTKRPIDVQEILSRPLVGLLDELDEKTVALWVRATMERVFLAAGIQNGVYFIDEDGALDR